ncbi:MAG: hypothetical protein LBQ12_15385, partial [Deltaproteobacteria bacterium]|nr:hypothetical protein [Deltaproteobacteria bacterium]
MEAGPGGYKFAADTDLRIEALTLRGAKRAGSPLDPDAVKAAILDSDSAGELLNRLDRLEPRTGFADAAYESGMAA